MSTIIVPQEVHGIRELIAVPRSSYRAFVSWQRAQKSTRTYTPTTAERRALKRARKNRAKGNFLTLEELRHAITLDR